MDPKRVSCRKLRVASDTGSERYYSALGGDTTFSGFFDKDVSNRRSQRSDRIRFQDEESLPLCDIERPRIISQFQPTEEGAERTSYFYAPESPDSVRENKLAHRNVFDSLEGWDEKEILATFSELSPLQIQVLEGCWKGQMDRVHDAVVKIRETRKGQSYTSIIINHHDSLGRTPLHFASAFGHSQIVQFLIQEGGLVNVWDKRNKVTPLGCSCACGSLPVIEILLAHNADVNAGVGRCFTPLHWAILSGSEECVKKVLKAQANPNAPTVEVGTPLHLAATHGSERCMKLLLDNGAKLEIIRGSEQWTALHTATNEGATECVQLLLQAGANIEAKDLRQQTPLHVSASVGDSETMGLLLTYHSNPGARDCDGRTPLHKAVSVTKGNESAECLLLLLEYAGELDAQDNNGHTPLHLAAINDSSFSASFLLQEGADVTVRTKTGQTALSLLVKKMPHVIRYIKESLDNSVTITTVDPNDPECELKLDFRAMIANPSKPSASNSQRTRVISPNAKTERPLSVDDMQRETEFLSCLIRTGYKSYLSHPLVESFIVLKWQRVRVFFWISLLFYTFLVLLYSVFVYEVYVVKCPFKVPPIREDMTSITNASSIFENDDSANQVTCYNLTSNLTERQRIQLSSVYCDLTDSIFQKVIWILLALILAVNTVKELFQMFQSFRGYFLVVEHYFQWLLLFSILMALWPVPFCAVCLEYWHYPSAATGILVAWSLMLVRIGRFPALGVYAQMLVKVIQNFSLFISAYACLIIAFAFAFTILFQNEPPFATIQESLLKTVTMMAGELNYDDLFYQSVKINGIEQDKLKVLNFPITAHFIFGGFVIFMTIIMMNLLVGLAVHDIQSLEKGAKVERLLRQTSSIAGLELFLFSKGLHAILPTSVGKFLRKRALLVPSSYKWAFYFHPNDPRDRRLPKPLVREALCLASSRQKQGKRPSFAKTKHTVRNQNTFRFQAQLDNMEIRLKDAYKKDLDNILTHIKRISATK